MMKIGANKKETLLNRLMRVPFLLSGIRMLSLAILLVMVYYSYNYRGINGVSVSDPLMYTNIATFLFWVLWLMVVVLSVLLFGRMWCTICPLGWLHGVFSMNCLKKDYPAGLKNNFLLIVFTFLVLFGAMSLNVHRFPDMTAKLILIFLIIVIILGSIFKKRVFCRYMCPIGGMLGLYSRTGPVELYVKDNNICGKCANTQCINGDTKWYKLTMKKAVLMYKTEKDGCPLGLVPNDLEDKSACDLCMNCFEVCPYKNLNVRYRKGMPDIAVNRPQVGNALFAVILMGLVSINFFKVFPKLRGGIMAPADYLIAVIGGFTAPAAELFKAIYGSVLLPLLFVGAISYVTLLITRANIMTVDISKESDIPKELAKVKKGAGAAPDKPGFAALFTAAAFSLIPLIFSAHIVLALVKLNTKLKYFPYIFMDPTGVKTYLSFNVFKNFEQPGVIIALAQLKWIITAVIAAGFAFSLIAAKKITDTTMQSSAKIGKKGFAVFAAAALIMAVLYLLTVYNWLFVMGM